MSENPDIDFRQLVADYYQPLYRFAYSLSKNEDEACDLTQQTFLVYAEKGDSLRDAGKVKSWLFTTLYREFLRIRRRGANMSVQEPEIIEAEAPPVDPGIVTKLDGRSAVEALEKVEESYREPLILFYLKDLSYKEIAEALSIPIGTVMSRLSRGKIQLKKALLSS
ncbi:RNA polymerase sigma factor [Cerasicoccus arenae]|uniref:RNA polymerase sigma factor n=1 Tax=Cerasicoccus arenae TaxID=424488 RepID=A0A8J3DEK2_9BACT|nr:RNA polymerase sigma factor [Cerasicoccus arenae]MBK1857671.1 RNA polymerase sigma factor [Cerasicoccus arenae]GHB91472.1 RNA polymerase sigma factor [Cerasicoccus arenae]